jgi:hypothetical protein
LSQRPLPLLKKGRLKILYIIEVIDMSIRVLIILSAANRIPLREGGTHPTGIFLGELTEPAEAMLKAAIPSPK